MTGLSDLSEMSKMSELTKMSVLSKMSELSGGAHCIRVITGEI
jgi:hypothetical protein